MEEIFTCSLQPSWGVQKLSHWGFIALIRCVASFTTTKWIPFHFSSTHSAVSSNSTVPILNWQKSSLNLESSRNFYSAEEPVLVSKPFCSLKSPRAMENCLCFYKGNSGKLRNQLAKLIGLEVFNAMIITYYSCVGDTC